MIYLIGGFALAGILVIVAPRLASRGAASDDAIIRGVADGAGAMLLIVAALISVGWWLAVG